MVGDEPAEELHAYVDAVVKAYMDEVVGRGRQRRESLLTKLRTASRKYTKNIQDKTSLYIRQAEAKKTEDGKGISMELAVIDDSLGAIAQEIRDIDSNMAGLTLEYEKYKKMLKDPSYTDNQDQKRMEGDAYLNALIQQVNYDQWQLAQQRIKSATGKSRSSKRLSEKVASTQRLIDEYRAALKSSFEEQRNLNPNKMLGQLRQDHDMQRKFFDRQREAKVAKVEELMTEAKGLGVRDAGMEVLQDEIEHLRIMQSEMETRMWEWEVEKEAPSPEDVEATAEKDKDEETEGGEKPIEDKSSSRAQAEGKESIDESKGDQDSSEKK